MVGDTNDEFTRGPTTFSQLLCSTDDEEDDNGGLVGLGLENHEALFHYSFSKSHKPPKMLCFETAYQTDHGDNSINSTNIKTKKRNGSDHQGNGEYMNSNVIKENSVVFNLKGVASNNSKKKKKGEEDDQNPTSVVGRVKVRKEKLGERIAALQQLVSPFGKTDTASVLHEAMGYIKFLHDQVHVLSAPYLHETGEKSGEEDGRRELRSRGLCLVPVDCIVDMVGTNGADFWSPGMETTGNSKLSTRKQ